MLIICNPWTLFQAMLMDCLSPWLRGTILSLHMYKLAENS